MNNLVYNNRAVIEVTKEFTFDSCHRLLEYNGACARYHGHTYKLQVSVEGIVDKIGMVIDFKDLKRHVKNEIVDKLDHYDLNNKFNFNTTAENMVVWMYDVLNTFISELELKEHRQLKVTKVRLWETPTSFAEYKGEWK